MARDRLARARASPRRAVSELDRPGQPAVDGRVEAPDPGADLDIQAGEAAALRRWEEFVDSGLADYADDRNRPDKPGTSRMSAHLKFGTIHPAHHGRRPGLPRQAVPGPTCGNWPSATSTPRCLHQWPDSAWWNWNRNFDAIEVDTGAEAKKAFEAWKQGRTGYPIVDAGMRQLRETGFMHNRVRMIVASFLVKDLHLPWQWGARWFLEQLVDGDMASNQHGWQWCAGSGTDAAPYFRVFNPTAQGEKFDPAGDYVRRWVPELADVDDVHKFKGGRPPGIRSRSSTTPPSASRRLRRYGQIG